MKNGWLFGARTAAALALFLFGPGSVFSQTTGTLFPAKAVRGPQAPAPSPEADATVIVYNTHDNESAGLARLYASKRGIANDHIIGLKCPVQEEITRADFDGTIADPMRELFTKNGWWDLRPVDHPLGRIERNRIKFVALIRGMPLKIAPCGVYPGDKPAGPPEAAGHNEASVDSELAVLGAYNRQISGPRPNEYFHSYARARDVNRPGLRRVCRLDAPTRAMVERMINDSIAAEKDGLRGIAYMDARNIQQAGYKEGDKWIYSAANVCRRNGIPAILDNGEGLFPEAYPMAHAALYYGWYTGNVAGPFVRPDFKFPRGAIAIHIHSFSAQTLRNAQSNWCAPLIAAGAAATFGSVYEPYLAFTPEIDIFNDRLISGFTFAESAWMAQRVTSWQTTMIGDPLYRPFAYMHDLDAKRGSGDWDEFRTGSKLWFEKNREAGEAALRASAKRMRSGAIWEGLGLLELTTSDGQEPALTCFREARRAYTSPDDILRCAIHEVILLRSMNRVPEAVVVAGKMADTYKKVRAVEVLRMLTGG